MVNLNYCLRKNHSHNWYPWIVLSERSLKQIRNSTGNICVQHINSKHKFSVYMGEINNCSFVKAQYLCKKERSERKPASSWILSHQLHHVDHHNWSTTFKATTVSYLQRLILIQIPQETSTWNIHSFPVTCITYCKLSSIFYQGLFELLKCVIFVCQCNNELSWKQNQTYRYKTSRD